MLNIQELVSNEEYEKVRQERRQRAMALKDRRRITVGPHLTLLFENRETLLYQIQEIMRAEKLHRQEDLELEAKLYSELLPSRGVLSACLFIEVTQEDQIRPTMRKMVGLDQGERVTIEFAGYCIPAKFEQGRSQENRISAVQYIRFHFTPDEMEALASAPEVILRINHPHYQEAATVPDAMRTEWLKDLLSH